MALGEVLGAIGGVIGGLFGRSDAEKAAEKQAALQREFAQNGIRWKVADAKAAGIHPLYALGAQTTAYSPVSVGGPDWGSIGQNVGRAMDVGRNDSERGAAFDKTAQALTLQKMGLENDLLASQIRMINQPGHPPVRGSGGSVEAPGSMSAGGGLQINVNPANTPQQDFENQYGEIIGEGAGIANFIDDLVRTASGLSPKAISEAARGDTIRQWLVETGAKSWASRPKTPRSYNVPKPASSSSRRYTFVP